MPTAIEVSNLSKSYPIGGRFWKRAKERRHQALFDVNLEINPGEIFGLVGRNGYGKTTLIKCIASLLVPSQGNVKVFGKDTVDSGLEVRRMIGWVGTEERSFYFRLTGRQNLLFFARLQGLSRAQSEATIERFSHELGIVELLDRRFHEYSTGNRQRLALLRGLLQGPQLLILDEPTRSLDPFAATALRDTLENWVQEEPERTILITSHNLGEIEDMSHRVGVMSKGHLRAIGPVDELRVRLGASEKIGFQLDRAPEHLEALLSELPQASWEQAHAQKTWLRFTHQLSDTLVDSTLRQVLAQGSQVLSVERTELTLQDIIDHVDKEAS